MKRSEVIQSIVTLLNQERDRRKLSNDFLAQLILERLERKGMMPPYSETKAKSAKPAGYEWDDT